MQNKNEVQIAFRKKENYKNEMYHEKKIITGGIEKHRKWKMWLNYNKNAENLISSD
jgi:hypothetical protein